MILIGLISSGLPAHISDQQTGEPNRYEESYSPWQAVKADDSSRDPALSSEELLLDHAGHPASSFQIENIARSNPTNVWTWALCALPFLAHALLSFGLCAFIVFYVKDAPFNLVQRRPPYDELDGTTHNLAHYRPLQTDITTLISVVLAILRTAIGVWYSATCWRCAIILLEKGGICFADFKWILSTKLPIMPISRRPRANHGTILLVAVILLIAIPAQYAAPFITGSITWTPGDHIVSGSVPLSRINDATTASLGGIGNNYIPYRHDSPAIWSWYYYCTSIDYRALARMKATALGLMAWSTDARSYGLAKRSLVEWPHLSINITVANITIPYFSVDSLQWLPNITANLTQEQIGAVLPNSGLTNVTSPTNPLQMNAVATLAIIADSPYDPPPVKLNPINATGGLGQIYVPSVGLPSPTKYVSRSAIVAVYVSHLPSQTACNGSVGDGLHPFGNVPKGIDYEAYYDKDIDWTNCYAFAQLTYTAGVATCYNCHSAAGNIVTNSSLQVEAEPLVDQALAMMPETIASMTVANLSLPPLWDNINQYTAEMLRRSYSASWTALSIYIAQSGPYLSTPVNITVPSTIARVSLWRVYAWLGLQMLATTSGLLFIGLQSTTNKPLVEDPPTEIFLLDAREVRERITRPDYQLSRHRKSIMRLQNDEDFSTVRYLDK